MRNPDYKIVIKDISSKVTNPREELLKNTKLKKPFIFKGYKSEADRIKDVVHNNRLLYNLPDYPDVQSERINRNKSQNQKNDIIYNFNINAPRKFKTINSNDNLNDLISKDKDINNDNLLTKKAESNLNSNNNTKTSFLNFKNNYSSLRKLSETEKNKYNDLIKKNLICQPQMRFTARTDLERVFDILILKNLRENDRYIIEKQLNKIDLLKFKRPKELLNLQIKKEKKEEDENKTEEKKYNVLPNPIIEEQKREIEKMKKENLLYGNKNLYYEPNNNNKKLWARKENLNNEARKILSEYHYKTHFKATEEAQFNIKKKCDTSNNNENEEKACLMIPNIFNTENNEINNSRNKKIQSLKNVKSKNKSFLDYLDYSEIDRKKDIFHFGEDLYKENEEGIQIKDYNELTKQYHNNPIFDNIVKKPNPNSIKVLSEIAFKKAEKSHESENEEKSENNEENSTNRLNEKYLENKKKNKVDENIHDTAKLILGECNIYSSKSKFNNSFLKSRAGKTMITKGLSVNDFLKKYSLNE